MDASPSISIIYLAVATMPPKRTRVSEPEIATALKRTRTVTRHCGTASQPVPADTQASQTPPLPPPSSPLLHLPPLPLLPRQALVNVSQAPNFEATIQELRAEDTIFPPTEGSEQATAASEAGNTAADEANFRWAEDNYNGFNWDHYCYDPLPASPRASARTYERPMRCHKTSSNKGHAAIT
jgi:type IV secretory pathway VirB10-like protein